MTVLWRGLKVGFAFSLIVLLSLSTAVLVYLWYGEMKETSGQAATPETPEVALARMDVEPIPTATPAPVVKPASIILDIPVIPQYPELPAGCEVTSLAMLLQYAGFDKSKMELYEELPKDPTPIEYNKDGSIKFWGNPNTGYVGDATPRAKGFAIFHAGVMPFLQRYIPEAIDLTREPFDKYEEQIAQGIPVVVWTTIDFKVPEKWVTWDSPLGLVRTTFKEHAVLLVGYDEDHVYVNDPASGKKAMKLNKNEFIATWVALGKQGVSYSNSN